MKVHLGDKQVDEKWKTPSNKRKNGKEESLKGNTREQQIMKTLNIHLKYLELGERKGLRQCSVSEVLETFSIWQILVQRQF